MKKKAAWKGSKRALNTIGNIQASLIRENISSFYFASVLSMLCAV
jgi:hypothetical protein